MSRFVKTSQMFENDLKATCKRSKETNSNSKARIDLLSIFNSKRYSIERGVILKKSTY